MSRIYSTLDPSNLGPALVLREGGLVVTCDTDSSNALRNARSTLGVSGSRWYWECIPYGDEALEDLVALGVVLEATAINTSPGVAAGTHGYIPGTGEILSSGSTVDTIAIAQPRDVIAFALDLIAGTPTLDLYINRLLVYSWTLAAGQTWHPAVSVGCVTAFSLSVFANFGRRAFENPVPDGYKAGLYQNPQVGNVLRLSDVDVLLGAGDTPPHARYKGDIRRPETFFIERSVTFWPDGRSGSSYSLGELVLDNQFGIYDSLLTDPPRDAPVQLALMELDSLGIPTGSPIPLPGGIFESASESRATEVTIKLRDPLAALQRPLQRKVFLPFTTEGAANRPYPVSLGAVRNMAPVLYDDVNRLYAAHDAPLTQVDAVRTNGDKLDPSASPPDYTLTPDARGIALQTEWGAKLTMDLSSQGNAEVTPPPLSDALEGYGDMATDTGGMPTNWLDRASTAHITNSRVATDGGRLEVRLSGIVGSSALDGWLVQFRDQATDLNFVPIRKGVRYRLTFDTKAARWPTGIGSLIYAAMRVSRPNQTGQDPTGQMAWTGAGEFSPGSVTAYFRADDDGTLAIEGQVQYDTAHNTDPGWLALPWYVQLDNVKVDALSAVPFDRLEGLGQMLSGLTAWFDAGSTGSSDFTQVDLVTGSYTLGRMRLRSIAGVARVAFDSAATAAGNPLFISGRHYRIAWTSIGNGTDARLNVINQTGGGDVVLGTYAAGVNEFSFVASDDGELVLEATTVGADAAYYVSYLRVLDTTDQDAEGSGEDTPLEGITLEQYFTEILEVRGEESATSWSHADAAAIDAATPYPFGVSTVEQISIFTALLAPLDGFNAAITSDNDNDLRIVQLRAPEDADESEIRMEITRNNCEVMPTMATDLAPGLTTNAGVRRNVSIYGPNDFVDDLDPITGIDAATRARFQRRSQYLVSAAVSLHSMYLSAQDAGPIEFLFDVREHGLAQLTLVDELFEVARVHYNIGPVYYEGAPPDLWPGNIVRLTWSRGTWDKGELVAGKQLLAKRVRVYPLAQRLDLTAWG